MHILTYMYFYKPLGLGLEFVKKTTTEANFDRLSGCINCLRVTWGDIDGKDHEDLLQGTSFPEG